MQRRKLSYAVCLVLSGATSTWAQQTPATPETRESIMVEARKPLNETHTINMGAFGSKDPMDIPVSVQSFSSSFIENVRARTVSDIFKYDPSVQEDTVGAGYDHLRLRGFAVDWGNTLRLDGMSLSPYQDVPLETVERVDVLKGPSGFLYGFNSPGGTVNFLPKRPTRDPFTAITVEGRNGDGRYAHVDTSASFGTEKNFGYRLNAAYQKVGDFHHLNDVERRVVALATDIRLSRDLVLQLNGDWHDQAIAAYPLIGLRTDGGLPPDVDPRKNLAPSWLQYESDFTNLGARLDYTLGKDWAFVGQIAKASAGRTAAFTDIYEVAANGDILSYDIAVSPDQKYDTINAQAYISGKFATGPVSHEVVAGIASRQYEAKEGGYWDLPISVGNILNPVDPARPATFPAAPPKNSVDNTQNAIFFSDLITITPKWQALVGARYVRYENAVTNGRTGVTPTPYKKNSAIPSLGLVFKPVEDITTYVSYAEGFEQGGVAPFNTLNAGEYKDPIKSEQIEAGIKMLVGRATLTVAAFEIEKALEYVNSGNVYVQAGRQRHRGVEAVVQGQVTPEWFVTAGVTFLDPKLVNTGDPATEGKRTHDVAKVAASAFVSYRVPGVAGLEVNAGVNHVGERPVNERNTVFIPAYTRMDLGASYRTRMMSHRVILRAQLKNVSDKFYWAAANFNSVYPGMGRTFHASATVDF